MSVLPAILMIAGTGLGVAASLKSSASQAKQLEYEVQKKEREKGQMASRQRALYAKSGVLVTEGSPLTVMADTANQYQQDIENLRKQKKAVKQIGYLNAGSTLLTGVSRSFGSFGGGGGGGGYDFGPSSASLAG